MNLGKVKVRLVGLLGGLAGKSEIVVELDKPATVEWLMSELVSELGRKEFKRALIDQELADASQRTIVIVNEKEIGILQGFKTALRDGDVVVLVPISHGG